MYPYKSGDACAMGLQRTSGQVLLQLTPSFRTKEPTCVFIAWRSNICMDSPLGVPGDLRAVSWSSFALRYVFACTGVPDPPKFVLLHLLLLLLVLCRWDVKEAINKHYNFH
jgi:hypothetical protein